MAGAFGQIQFPGAPRSDHHVAKGHPKAHHDQSASDEQPVRTLSKALMHDNYGNVSQINSACLSPRAKFPFLNSKTHTQELLHVISSWKNHHDKCYTKPADLSRMDWMKWVPGPCPPEYDHVSCFDPMGNGLVKRHWRNDVEGCPQELEHDECLDWEPCRQKSVCVLFPENAFLIGTNVCQSRAVVRNDRSRPSREKPTICSFC
jgi:hypothetical protein